VESRERAQRAVDELWGFTGELFTVDQVEREVAAQGVGVDSSTLRAPWEVSVKQVLGDATLVVPDIAPRTTGGRIGRHTEHLGHMLAEMQILPRSHPGAKW
jgi:ring-1,2-phenylacetyl-CoA epoxidase subunit PaaC